MCEPFTFENRKSARTMDFEKLMRFDLAAVLKNGDVARLHDVLDTLAFGRIPTKSDNLPEDQLHQFNTQALVKALRVSQVIIEYTLATQEVLVAERDNAARDVVKTVKKLNRLRAKLAEADISNSPRSEENARGLSPVSDKNRNDFSVTSTGLLTDSDINSTSKTRPSIHGCPHCPKYFVSEWYLRKHVEKRHSEQCERLSAITIEEQAAQTKQHELDALCAPPTVEVPNHDTIQMYEQRIKEMEQEMSRQKRAYEEEKGQIENERKIITSELEETRAELMSMTHKFQNARTEFQELFDEMDVLKTRCHRQEEELSLSLQEDMSGVHLNINIDDENPSTSEDIRMKDQTIALLREQLTQKESEIDRADCDVKNATLEMESLLMGFQLLTDSQMNSKSLLENIIAALENKRSSISYAENVQTEEIVVSSSVERLQDGIVESEAVLNKDIDESTSTNDDHHAHVKEREKYNTARKYDSQIDVHDEGAIDTLVDIADIVDSVEVEEIDEASEVEEVDDVHAGQNFFAYNNENEKMESCDEYITSSINKDATGDRQEDKPDMISKGPDDALMDISDGNKPTVSSKEIKNIDNDEEDNFSEVDSLEAVSINDEDEVQVPNDTPTNENRKGPKPSRSNCSWTNAELDYIDNIYNSPQKHNDSAESDSDASEIENLENLHMDVVDESISAVIRDSRCESSVLDFDQDDDIIDESIDEGKAFTLSDYIL